jgi:hypothetical protein
MTIMATAPSHFPTAPVGIQLSLVNLEKVLIIASPSMSDIKIPCLTYIVK